jgi:hypothetical protein
MLKATTWYVMRHQGDVPLTPQAIEGITEVKWLGLHQTEEVMKNTYPSVMEVLRFTSAYIEGQRTDTLDIDGGF